LILIFGQSHKHVLCGSQTGSGKTVAYLAPVFHYLKTQEVEAIEKKHDFEMVEATTIDGVVNVNQGLSAV